METLHLSPFPVLQPGERVLAIRRNVRALCSESPPAYRWFFGLPPVFDAALYVTDRRVLVVAGVFRLLYQEFSQWLPEAPSAGPETVVEMSVGETRLLGSCLIVTSETTARSWMRSPRARLRYYVSSPEELRDLIAFPGTNVEQENQPWQVKPTS